VRKHHVQLAMEDFQESLRAMHRCRQPRRSPAPFDDQLRRDPDLPTLYGYGGAESVDQRDMRTHRHGTDNEDRVTFRSDMGSNLRLLESALLIQTRTSKAAHQASQRKRWTFIGLSASLLCRERHATPLTGWKMSPRSFFGRQHRKEYRRDHHRHLGGVPPTRPNW